MSVATALKERLNNRSSSDTAPTIKRGAAMNKKMDDDTLVKAMRAASDGTNQRKVSYAIACASEFRDKINLLAEKRNVNAGDLARSVILTVPEKVIQTVTDPGEPEPHDRETIILKSGPSAGKPWRRKPRLQVRMPAGFNMITIRKALALALKLDSGELDITLEDPTVEKVPQQSPEDKEKIIRLHTIVSALSFDLLKGGIQTYEEALYVLGFPPTARPSMDEIKQRFRLMATIHHPDSDMGNHDRMTQLNDAISLLRRTTLR